MYKYEHDKKIIVELATTECQRYVVNALETNRKRAMREANKLAQEPIYTEEDFAGGLIQTQLRKIPVNDNPPLTSVKEEGEQAELATLVHIAASSNIFTTVDMDASEVLTANETVIDYEKFLTEESINGVPGVLFTPENYKEVGSVMKQTGGKSAKFKVDFVSGDVQANFQHVFDDRKQQRFVFQPEFPATSTLYETIIRICNNEEVGSDILKEFKKFRPDMIEIIPKEQQVMVLNERYEVVTSNPNKIKLKVYDIKMSQYSSRFPIEVVYYCMRLQHFLVESGLDAHYEVCSEGAILPYNSKKQLASMTTFEALEKWDVYFESERAKLLNVFKTKLNQVYTTILTGDLKAYDTFFDMPRCKTCEFYGEQRSEMIVDFVRGGSRDGKCSDADFARFYEQNGYCRAMSVKRDDINTLRNLSTSLKRLLKQNGIYTIDALFQQMYRHPIFTTNKNLAALISDFEQLQKMRGLQP